MSGVMRPRMERESCVVRLPLGRRVNQPWRTPARSAAVAQASMPTRPVSL